MFDIMIEGIARADPFDYQSCAGVEYCGKTRLLVPVLVSISGRELRPDDFRDRGGYVQHDLPHEQRSSIRIVPFSASPGRVHYVILSRHTGSRQRVGRNGRRLLKSAQPSGQFTQTRKGGARTERRTAV